MKVEFEVMSMGYVVGGSRIFDVEIEDSELEGMSEDERRDYVHKVCWEYVLEDLEVCILNDDF